MSISMTNASDTEVSSCDISEGYATLIAAELGITKQELLDKLDADHPSGFTFDQAIIMQSQDPESSGYQSHARALGYVALSKESFDSSTEIGLLNGYRSYYQALGQTANALNKIVKLYTLSDDMVNEFERQLMEDFSTGMGVVGRLRTIIQQNRLVTE